MKLSREKNLPLVTAAAKAGMGEKAARKYFRSGLLPSQMKKPRDWRTREDPFIDVWPEAEALISEEPNLEALTVFKELQRRYPGKFQDGQLRTLQRRIRVWRGLNGPDVEIFFPQTHQPGIQGQSDFTSMNVLDITMGGLFFLTIEKGSLSYPNVFAVVRSCPTASRRYKGVFDYTAGLLLLSKMKSVLETWCANTCLCELKDYCGNCPLVFSSADECLNALEYPLGSNSRSVSDLAFSSGIVDFGRQAREEEWDASVAGDPFDEQRRTIEKCVYPNGWRLFYIPIHVGGTPWLALFTFTPQDPASNQTAWHHNYSFYRDLAQKAAALIRQEAHDAYANLLSKHFVKHMESWITPMDTILSRINHDAQKLAQVYPFPMAKFTEDRQSPNSVFVPGRGIVTVSFKSNPFFTRQVSWHLGDDQAILRQCREAIGDFTRIEQSIEINAVAQSSHLLKIPLRVLDSIASSTTGDKFHALHRQIRKILDLHDVASALMSETKREMFRTQYRKDGTFQELKQILSNQYAASTSYLIEPAVSGNFAPRFRTLLNQGRIVFASDIVDRGEGRYAYYEPLIVAILDGLLTNAIDAVDLSNPSVLVNLARSEDNQTLFLCVENTTDIEQERLAILVRNLNAPGPDMVGITELHWMSKACWPSVNSGERLSWTVLANPRRVLARAMIAEVRL